jgi:NAD+ synthase (glutamine-hydrolysing)
MSRPSFHSIHRHGLVRVAAATPLATVGDVDANVVAILDLGAQAHRAGADLVLFPELSVSSYASDDLLGQDALLDRLERGL